MYLYLRLRSGGWVWVIVTEWCLVLSSPTLIIKLLRNGHSEGLVRAVLSHRAGKDSEAASGLSQRARVN